MTQRAKTAYAVIPVHAADLKVSLAADHEILFEGDTAGVADFFADLTRGIPYAVLAMAPPERHDQVRNTLLKSRALAAELVACLFSARSKFPAALDPDLESQGQSYALEVTSTLDQWLYDHLPKLQEALHRIIHLEGP